MLIDILLPDHSQFKSRLYNKSVERMFTKMNDIVAPNSSSLGCDNSLSTVLNVKCYSWYYVKIKSWIYLTPPLCLYKRSIVDYCMTYIPCWLNEKRIFLVPSWYINVTNHVELWLARNSQLPFTRSKVSSSVYTVW